MAENRIQIFAPGRLTHVVLLADGHAEPQQEIRHGRMSRRTGPVQRGAAVLWRGSGGQRAPGRAVALRRPAPAADRSTG